MSNEHDQTIQTQQQGISPSIQLQDHDHRADAAYHDGERPRAFADPRPDVRLISESQHVDQCRQRNAHPNKPVDVPIFLGGRGCKKKKKRIT